MRDEPMPEPNPRHSATRHMLGVRWPWWKDRQCRRHGHVLSETESVGMLGGAYWPICTRCGYAVEPARDETP